MHSTCHAVYSVSRILKKVEEEDHGIRIFIDLSKAFASDTIEHSKFQERLMRYGIGVNAHEILQSCTSLVVDNKISEGRIRQM